MTRTEHRLHQRRCGYGTVTTAAAPVGVAAAPASYGPNLRAWVVYALVFQHIPVARVVELVTDVSGARWWLHGVLDGFTGVLVHDCWASYNAYTDCAHTLCGARIARPPRPRTVSLSDSTGRGPLLLDTLSAR